MAHDITLTIPPISVQSSDHDLEVRLDGELLGHLRISKGGLDWYRANAKRVTGTRSWTELRDWMEK